MEQPNNHDGAVKAWWDGLSWPQRQEEAHKLLGEGGWNTWILRWDQLMLRNQQKLLNAYYSEKPRDSRDGTGDSAGKNQPDRRCAVSNPDQH